MYVITTPRYGEGRNMRGVVTTLVEGPEGRNDHVPRNEGRYEGS